MTAYKKSNAPLPSLIQLTGIVKNFGGVQALRGVDLDVRPGEVHALLGENGAGKSTLIKVLSGVHSPSSGSMKIDGREVQFANPADSRSHGVGVVYQDLSLVESLTVADNLLLGREPRNKLGIVKNRRLISEATQFLKERRIPLDPRARVSSLPFAYRQMTEISKALLGHVRILILDEPTSALTDNEETILFDSIRQAANRGVGVIYVTHRLKEVFTISDRVTVFRNGENAGQFTTSDTTMDELVYAIVGSDGPPPGANADLQYGSGSAREQGKRDIAAPLALRLHNVGNDQVRGINLEVRSGEIHGIAGLIGSGRTEILQTIFGLRKPEAGEIQIEGQQVEINNPSDAIRQGIALVPEDRHVEGLVLDHTIESNLTLPRLRLLSRYGRVQKRAAISTASSAMKQLAVKARHPWTVVNTLSGGNQQKVVFAKWSDPRPNILMLDEPTTGVDIGAREEIYGVIRDAAENGTATLIVSSDLPELLALCDSISIVINGRINRTVRREELANAEQLHRMFHDFDSTETRAS